MDKALPVFFCIHAQPTVLDLALVFSIEPSLHCLRIDAGQNSARSSLSLVVPELALRNVGLVETLLPSVVEGMVLFTFAEHCQSQHGRLFTPQRSIRRLPCMRRSRALCNWFAHGLCIWAPLHRH